MMLSLDLKKHAKTFLDLQIAYKEIFDERVWTDQQKLQRIASLQLAEKSKWIPVSVLEGKVFLNKKQLSERVLEIDKPSNGYGEVCEQNRQYRILLKELLLGSEGSAPLSKEEIGDLEKEIASGKCKTFKTAEELIAFIMKEGERVQRRQPE